MKNCCVIGLGYIGLPTAVILAKTGHQVIGVDIDLEKIELLKKGIVYIKEPDLKDIFDEVITTKKLKLNNKPSKADIFIIAVPTPFYEDNSIIPKPNMEYLYSAINSIAKILEPGNLVIIESTCPVGTTVSVGEMIFKETNYNKEQIEISYCPERVLPGKILKELVSNDRVIGGLTHKASETSRDFYETFCKGKIHTTDSNTAEMVKLSENAFRDVNIAYANELSMICDRFSVDVNELINLANKHPRVKILSPGCGVGGHCIAVDPWFLASAEPEITNMIQTARFVNNNKIEWAFKKIIKTVNQLQEKNQSQINIGCLGLSFKPDVDDLRCSPALQIVNKLIDYGYKVFVCEPNITSHEDFNLYDINAVLKSCDVIVALVAHSSFKKIVVSGKEVVNLCGLDLDI